MRHRRDESDDTLLIVDADDGLSEATVEAFVREIEDLVEDGAVRRIIVDCAELAFLNSSGLNALLRMRSRLDEQGADNRVTLRALGAQPREVLESTRLDRLFAIA